MNLLRVQERRQLCPATIQSALRWSVHQLVAAEVENPRLDAELLLAFSLGFEREDIYRKTDAYLDATTREQLTDLIQRRGRGEPIAHITGRKNFYKYEFFVSKEVLSPRPESELLLQHALEAVRTKTATGSQHLQAIDIGTGSGSLSISLVNECSALKMTAIDISSEALEVAKKNATALLSTDSRKRLHFVQQNFIDTDFGANSLDLIVSNPPYIPTSELCSLPREVQREPKIALDGGVDGLRWIEPLLQKSFLWLKEGGTLVIEIGAGQHDAVGRLLKGHGWKRITFFRDLAAIKRCLVAVK